MKLNKNYIYSGLFLSIIFSGLIVSTVQEDKTFSEMENKILTKCPEINIKSIKDGSYMDKIDDYVVDQFPYRTAFIKLKNSTMNLIGYKEFKDIFISNDRMLENFKSNQELIFKNIEYMNKINSCLDIESTGMFIPNSVLIYEENIPSYAKIDSQKDTLKYIESIYNGEFYTPYNELLKNKDKYIYFRTDHHWTQLGAKLMYEDYYNKKLNLTYKLKANNFLGTYYSKTLLKESLKDSIYSYEELKNYNIEYDGSFSNSLYDESKLEGKNKYQYFLNGDPSLAIVDGEGEGEVVVFKDSFAHCYIPFLTQEYEKIHIIDTRYCNMDIIDYIKSNKGISKVYYIYSISTLNSNDLFTKYKNYIN